MSEYLAKAKQLISQHPYLMISKSWCPDCHYVYNIWSKFNVKDKVHIIELDKMDPVEATHLEQAFTEISGRKWVPTIWFNGEKFGTEQDLKIPDAQIEEIFKRENLI